MRIKVVVAALAAAGIIGAVITGCGEDIADSSDGNVAAAAEANCVDDDGHDVCDAMDGDAVTVEATANGKFVELYDSTGGGDIVNCSDMTCEGDSRLVQSGDTFRVVCYGDDSFGVLLTTDFNVVGGGQEYFATGKVEDRNFANVVFMGTRGFDDADAVKDELSGSLEEKFEDVKSNSCNDNRVVVSELGKSLVTSDS